jgi:putative hydrolase of the HAD superfamily
MTTSSAKAPATIGTHCLKAGSTCDNHPSSPTSANDRVRDCVKLIVFDMGHVFIDFKFSEVCSGFCNHAGITFEEMAPALMRLARLGYETGDVTTAEFLAKLNSELKDASPHPKDKWRDLTLDEFHNFWNQNFSENQEMAALLQELGKNWRLALLSNTNESHFHALESKFKVTRHFDHVFLSYLLGVQKPDRRIYERVVHETGISPNEIVFVDDLSANISAAAECGLVTIHFQNPTQLKEDLRRLGILD